MFRLTFRLSKKFYLMATLRAIVNAFKSLIAVYGLGLIIIALTNKDFLIAMYYAMGIAVAEMLIRFFEITFETSTLVMHFDMVVKIKQHIADKLMKVEFNYLENPKYLTAADQARFAVDNYQDVHSFLFSVMFILEQFFTIASLLTLIVIFKPIIIIIIVFSAAVHFWVSKVSQVKQKDLYKELGPVNRKLTYYEKAVQDPRYQKDYRIYPLGDLIYKRYSKFLDETCDYLIYFNKVTGRFQTYFSFLNFAQVILIYLIIGTSAVLNGTGVAEYVILTASALRVSTAIDIFIQRISQARNSTIRLSPVFQVLDMEDAITLSSKGVICQPFESLTFKNV